MPQEVTFSNGASIRYEYDAAGTKRRVIRRIEQSTSVTDYTGGMIYENGKLSTIQTENGYIRFSRASPVYHYYLSDYPGNNRVMINAAGSVQQVNRYYPFGGIMAESTGGEVQPWKFGGRKSWIKPEA